MSLESTINFDLVFQSVDETFVIEFDSTDDSFDVEFGDVTVIDTEPYEGGYIVTPTFEVQTLETANKKMAEDVVVLDIPMSEVSNLYGVTLNIGG